MKIVLQCGHRIEEAQLRKDEDGNVFEHPKHAFCEMCQAIKNERKPMLKGEALIEAAFKAVREDRHIGRGSCSSVDECMTDEELKAEIVRLIAGVKYPSATQVLREMWGVERVRLEYARDIESTAW